MEFDASSAVAIEDEFDPSSASPVEATAEFDSSSAAPVEEGQSFGDMARRVPASIAKAAADTIVGVSRLPHPVLDLVKNVPGGKELIKQGQEYFQQLGESAPSSYGVDESQNQTLPSKLISGAASLVPAIAAGPAAPAAMASMMGENLRQEAEAAGATEGQKDIAFVGGAAVGALSEALMGVPALLRSARAAKIPEATFKAISKEAAVQALKSAGREFTQEGIEQAGQNIIASKIAAYDPNRKVSQGVLESAALGAVIGGPVGAITQTAASLDAISAQSRATAAQVDSTIEDVATSVPPPVISTPSTEPPKVGGPVPAATVEAPERAAQAITEQGGESNATQERPITESSQPERTGTDAQRQAAETGSSNRPAESGQVAPEIDSKIKSAYEDIVGNSGFIDVNISELQKRTGLPMEEVQNWVRKQSREGNAVPSRGDWSLSSEEVRKGGIEIGQGENFLDRMHLKVRLEPEFRQSIGAPSQVSEEVKSGLIHPDDAPTLALIRRVAAKVGKASGIEEKIGKPVTVRPKSRPFGDTAGSYQVGGGRVTLDLRIRSRKSEGGKWFKNPHPLSEVVDTLTHELAHENVPKSEGPALRAEMARIRPMVEAALLDEGYVKEGKNYVPAKQAVETTGTPETQPTGEQIPTTTEGSEGYPTASAQGAVTENLSASQLETKLDSAIQNWKLAQTPEEKSRLWKEAQAVQAQINQAQGQSMGPGAASAAETLVKYAERKFGVRFEEDPRIAAELKAAAGNRYYEVLPHRVTAAEATELLDRLGDDQAERLIRDEGSNASFAVRSTVGQILIQRLNRKYQQLKDTNPKEAQAVLNRSADLSEWQMDFGTRLGQGVNSFAMWAKLSPEGKLQIIKKAVRKSRERYTQRHETEVKEVLDVLGTDRTAEEKTIDMKRLGKSNRTARKVRKNLKQLTENPQTADSFYDIAGKDLGLPELTGEQELKLRELASKVDAAPDGLPKWEAAKEFRSYAENIKGFNLSDFAFGYYYGNILSGFGTQIVNTVDTALNVLHEVNALAAVNPKAAAIIYSALGRGVANSRADAFLALTKGRKVSNSSIGESMGVMEQSKFGQKGGVAILDKGITTRTAKALLEAKPATVLNAWKYIGRAMSASDAVMFRGAQEAKAGLLAYKIATEEGLTSSQRTKRVNEILGWDRFDEFMEQAKKEGYSGMEQAARVTELMIMQRPEGLQQDSSAFASLATYNSKPEGILGNVARFVSQLSAKHPGFRLIVPFANIVANVFNRRLDNLPGVALYRARRGYYESEEAGKNAIMRGYISFGMITGLLGMVAGGLIEITGPGPDDPEKKRQLRESGWRPYSIKAGDKYFSFANTPISFALGIIGNVMDWSRYQKPDEKKDKAILTAVTYSLFKLGSYLFSQSFISGLSNFFDMVGSSQGKTEFAINNFVSQTTSAFSPLSGAMKDLDSIFDDTKRSAKTMETAVLSQIPFVRYAGRPALNAFGEPIKTGKIRPLARFVSQKTDDKAWGVIADKNLRVPVPDPHFKTDEQNYEYQKESGKQTKQWVLDNTDTLRSLSSVDAQELMNKSTAIIREGIRTNITLKQLNDAQK